MIGMSPSHDLQVLCSGRFRYEGPLSGKPNSRAKYDNFKSGIQGHLSIFTTYTNQNPLFCRVPINSIYGFIFRTYKIVGFGWFRYVINSK